MDKAQIQEKLGDTQEKIGTLGSCIKEWIDTEEKMISKVGQGAYNMIIATYRFRLNRLIEERDGYVRQLCL